MVEACREARREAMLEDESVFNLGEDIGDAEGGGTFKVTKGLSTEFGTGRVRTTPISEQAVVGAAIGSAIAGMRPVAEIMLMDSYYPGWLVFVDDGGHRFVNEQAAYSVVESTFQARDGRAWATF